VLCLGERSWRKNTEGAVRALAAAGPALAKHALVLVGPPGHGAEAASEAVSRLGLAERVVVADYVARPEVAALLARADALVFPTRYEGFGMPVLEAFEAGVPVVASRDPSVLEVAGGAALHADADDVDALAAHLARVVEDRALRADLVARGRARAAAFTWDAAGKKLARVYRAARARAAAPDVDDEPLSSAEAALP
jgi:glycosyltransferase involved in cell wall biosynthesis